MSVLTLQASTINHKLLRSASQSKINLPVLLPEDASIMIALTLLPIPLLVKPLLLLQSAHPTWSADNSTVQMFQECASNLTHHQFHSATSQTDVLIKIMPMATSTWLTSANSRPMPLLANPESSVNGTELLLTAQLLTLINQLISADMILAIILFHPSGTIKHANGVAQLIQATTPTLVLTTNMTPETPQRSRCAKVLPPLIAATTIAANGSGQHQSSHLVSQTPVLTTALRAHTPKESTNARMPTLQNPVDLSAVTGTTQSHCSLRTSATHNSSPARNNILGNLAWTKLINGNANTIQTVNGAKVPNSLVKMASALSLTWLQTLLQLWDASTLTKLAAPMVADGTQERSRPVTRMFKMENQSSYGTSAILQLLLDGLPFSIMHLLLH